MQSLRRTRPANLEDLTIQVAIVRPGPIQGGAINPYIERRRRLREDPGYEIPYDHPALEPVLKETLGTIIFQDQVMQVAEAFAGFTPGEADGLRRAMSRKRSQEMLQRHRERFIAGAMRHVGAEQRTAERVWEMVEGFAGFGFPKAHSAAFGLLAYQSTWLRVHYGPEFLCALLNEQPMGFYAPDSLVHEAEHHGIEVLGLDVNASQVQCTVETLPDRRIPGWACAWAWATSRMWRRPRRTSSWHERERNGPLPQPRRARRARRARGERRSSSWPGRAPATASWRGRRSVDRRTALWQLGVAATGQGAGEGTQLALALELPPAPRLRPLGRWQRLIADYATSGVTVATTRWPSCASGSRCRCSPPAPSWPACPRAARWRWRDW